MLSRILCYTVREECLNEVNYMKRAEAIRLFEQMHPGFFERPFIRAMGKERVFEEMILALDGFCVERKRIPVPDGVAFGMFTGDDLRALHESVREVDEDWVQYFDKPEEIYCAFDGDRIVSFCLLDNMGEHEFGGRRVKVAGPGCVGTIPAYRKKGIGLRMVQNATQILKDGGYDLSYIHYTGVGHWYANLGYETLCKWNRDGVVAAQE